jgi:hypothetical protein
MNFEKLMKNIEEEVNKKSYNSYVILSNTKTKNQIIIKKDEVLFIIPKQRKPFKKQQPKEEPKEEQPTNFFNIPLDIRQIIYNKVRTIKEKERKLKMYFSPLPDRYIKIKCNCIRKKEKQINFIDSDDEEELPEINEDINNYVPKISKKIIDSRRDGRDKYYYKKDSNFTTITQYYYPYDTNEEDIINYELNYLKDNYFNYTPKFIDVEIIKVGVNFDFKNKCKEEIGDDKDFLNLEKEYNEIRKKEYDYLEGASDWERYENFKKEYNQKFKELLFIKIYDKVF